jgi:hypothetical protein
VHSPLAALSLAGLVAYGIVRLAYAEFYSAFGLTPEEVGLGYQETIAQAGLALLLLALLATFGAGLAILLYGLASVLYFGVLMRLVTGIRGTPEERRARQYETYLRYTSSRYLSFFATMLDPSVSMGKRILGLRRPAVGGGIVIGSLGVALYLFITAHDAADDVRAGQPVPRPELFGLPFLQIGAERVVIDEVEPRSEKLVSATRCTLYLGQAGGTTFLFFPAVDALPAETLRIPPNQVAVHSKVAAKPCPESPLSSR